MSHDRAFVSALATRILEVTEDGFRDFPGTYDEYLGKRGDDHLDADAVVLKAKKQAAAAPAKAATTAPAKGAAPARTTGNGAPSTLSWEDQKKRKNRKKQLPGLRDAAVHAIEAAEARKATIHSQWCEAGFFDRTPAATVAGLEAEEKALGPRIEALTAEWEALEKEIEELAD